MEYFVGAIVIFCGLLPFVAFAIGPIGTWTDTAVYCFAASVGVAFCTWLSDRDLARACRLRKAAMNDERGLTAPPTQLRLIHGGRR
jgi:hypothetical protein